jgi:tRNA U34 5-methylaminomethyl-2-thiouridine-forming methyltransferase MnmC
MDKIITKDGSVTFYNPEYKDYYHSTSGALDESFKKYVDPCRISYLAASCADVSILEIGFGLGYNLAAAVDTMKASNPTAKLTFVSLEKDPGVFSLIQKVDPIIPSYAISRRVADLFSKGDDRVALVEGYMDVCVLIGDAVVRIKEVDAKFDAIFLDAFAPKKNPELWTEDFFRELVSRLKPEGMLATYSCAKDVRDNLMAAGFKVMDGPTVGRRGPSTLAVRA